MYEGTHRAPFLSLASPGSFFLCACAHRIYDVYAAYIYIRALRAYIYYNIYIYMCVRACSLSFALVVGASLHMHTLITEGSSSRRYTVALELLKMGLWERLS